MLLGFTVLDTGPAGLRNQDYFKSNYKYPTEDSSENCLGLFHCHPGTFKTSGLASIYESPPSYSNCLEFVVLY